MTDAELIDRADLRGVGWCVRELNRILARKLQSRLEPLGVTLAQYQLLLELWKEDGLSQRELSARLDVAAPWTVTAINAMVESGFVSRLQKKEDRRFAYVHLTPKGRRMKYKLVPEAWAVNAIACAGFEEADVESIKAALNAMRENLEKNEPAEGNRRLR